MVQPLDIPVTPSFSIVGRFETVDALGFSADDLVYDPSTDLLLACASGDQEDSSFASGIFKVTLDGKLKGHITFESINGEKEGLGYGIALATIGPKQGHFFLTNLGKQASKILELDEAWDLLDFLSVASTYSDAYPGDGIAYNPVRDRVIVSDEIHRELFEIKPGGGQTPFLSGVLVEGIVFVERTGTYFAVNVEGKLLEISADGAVLQQIDLLPSGLQRLVGIASAGDRLFIADELNNMDGWIYIMEFVA